MRGPFISGNIQSEAADLQPPIVYCKKLFFTPSSQEPKHQAQQHRHREEKI